MNVTEAEKHFANLVDQVYVKGITVDLERDNKVIARLTPVPVSPSLTIGELNVFLRSLPRLGDDAEAFANDIRAIRNEFPPEAGGWD